LNVATLRPNASFRGQDPASTKIFFSVFVDWIFTTLFEPLFTKLFDVIGPNSAIACLYRACNAD
jgi:hypothetical protein